MQNTKTENQNPTFHSQDPNTKLQIPTPQHKISISNQIQHPTPE